MTSHHITSYIKGLCTLWNIFTLREDIKETPNNNNKPSKNNKPNNNNKPSKNNKPNNNNKTNSNNKPNNNNKPSNNNKPNNNNKPSSNNKPNNHNKSNNNNKTIRLSTPKYIKVYLTGGAGSYGTGLPR